MTAVRPSAARLRLSPPLLRALTTTAWWLLAGWVAYVVFVAAQAPHQDYFDAQVQLGAVRDLVTGADPYSKYVQSPLWTYLFMLPYGFLPADAAYPAQFAGNLLMWFVACILLLRAARVSWGRPRTLVVAGLLTVFAPAIWATRGQVNAYNALGIALFLVLLPRRPVWAGAALVLLLAKPHIGFVTLGALLAWMMLAGRWRPLVGFAAAFAVSTGLTFALRPQWPWQWYTALTNPLPEVVAGRAKYAPTVGYFLGQWLPGVVATIAGAAAAIFTTATLGWWLLRERERLSAQQVVAVSGPAVFLITPYSQGYDISLIVPSLALLVGAWFRLSGRARGWLSAGMAVCYIFPYAMVVLNWPQATLLIPATLCLVLCVVYRDRLGGEEGELTAQGGQARAAAAGA